MKISYITVIALLCMAATGCNKKDTTGNTNPTKNTPVYSITISGDRQLLQPLQFTANGTEGHKVFWDFGDQESGNDQQVSHIYNRPDSFTVKLMLDDRNTNPVATARIGISTGIEKYNGTYTWHVHYSIDSMGKKSELDAVRDIAVMSTGNTIVAVGADTGKISAFDNFSTPAYYTFDTATRDVYIYKAGKGVFKYYPKTGEINFIRVINDSGGFYSWYCTATYTK